MLQPLALKRTHKQVFGGGACSLIVRCKENLFSLEFSLGISRICVMYEGGWGVGGSGGPESQHRVHRVLSSITSGPVVLGCG